MYRLVLAGLFTALPLFAHAQDRTLYVAGAGGSYETIMKGKIFPAFEASHKLRMAYVTGNSTDTLAKLQAQRGRQELDVALMDDGPTYQAISLGFCAPVKPGPHYSELYDIAKLGDQAVGLGFTTTGIAYNAAAFKQRGWDPPRKWTDLADPKFRKLIAMPPASGSTYGLNALVMYARIAGGSEANIGPGFDYIAKNIAPNILAFEPSTGRMAELLQDNEIVAAIWGSGRTVALADTGFPAKFVAPEEGAPVIMTGACTVTGSHLPDDAQAFVDYLISPDIQQIIAREMGLGPANRTVTLPADVAAKVPYGAAAIGKLAKMDWTEANQHRDEWNKRWTREIER